MQISALETSQSVKKRGAKALRLSLLTLFFAASTAHIAFSQESEEDTTGPIVDVSEDALTNIADETPLNQRLRIDPIGAVNEGTPIEEGDPYEAQGIRLGNFIFRPSLEIGLSGTIDNASVDDGTGAALAETSTSLGNENALRLLINSDWSRHALELEATGILPLAISGDATSPTYGLVGSLRVDVSSATTLTLGGEFSSTNEDPQSSAYQTATDPTLNPNITGVNEPSTRLFAGNAALAHDFGAITTQINATIGRLQYSEAKLSDGSSVSQDDLNSTDYDFALRGGYALSGVLSPFVEANYGVRVMDEAIDSSGVDRNATRYGLRLGTTIDMGEKFGGEVSIGYAREKLADDNFEAIQAVTLAADLNWSPARNTDVSLGLTTDIDPSGLENIAGSTVYATELGLTHRLRSNLTATANVNAAFEDYAGPRFSETTLGAGAGLTYSFNPYLALSGRVSYEKTLSAGELQRSDTVSAFVGLRLQR